MLRPNVTRCQARCDTLIVNLQQTMTSLEIAELTGKQHKHVMEAIRKMEPAWVKVNGLKFQLVEYKDAKGELRPITRCQARCGHAVTHVRRSNFALLNTMTMTTLTTTLSHGARHAVTWRCRDTPSW